MTVVLAGAVAQVAAASARAYEIVGVQGGAPTGMVKSPDRSIRGRVIEGALTIAGNAMATVDFELR